MNINSKEDFLSAIHNLDPQGSNSQVNISTLLIKYPIFHEYFTPSERKTISNLANGYGRKAIYQQEIITANRLQSLAQKQPKVAKIKYPDIIMEPIQPKLTNYYGLSLAIIVSMIAIYFVIQYLTYFVVFGITGLIVFLFLYATQDINKNLTE